MNPTFRNAFLTLFAITTINPLISMQPAPAQQVIVRLSNMMENQRAIVTFETSKLGVVSVEANQDLMLAPLGEGRNNRLEELINQHQGIPTRDFTGRIHISTPLGVATLLGGGDSTMIQFYPYSGKLTILSHKAKQLRIIIDATGHVSLVDDQAKSVKVP